MVLNQADPSTKRSNRRVGFFKTQTGKDQRFQTLMVVYIGCSIYKCEMKGFLIHWNLPSMLRFEPSESFVPKSSKISINQGPFAVTIRETML